MCDRPRIGIALVLAVATALAGASAVVAASPTTVRGPALQTDAAPVERAVLWDQGQIGELGTLGGASSYARALNDVGQVVGASDTSDGDFHAVLWQDGQITDLGTLGGDFSVANDINDNGQIVGASETASGAVHAVLWSDGEVQDLGTIFDGDSEALAINDAGQVAIDLGAIGEEPGLRWSDDALLNLAPLGGGDSRPLDLNVYGEATGSAETANGQTHGVLWLAQGNAVELAPEADFSEGNGINESGQVAGYFGPDADNVRAFRWSAGELIDLGTLGGPTSRAYGIDPTGKVVGRADTADGESHAFLWDENASGGADERMLDLGTLGGANSWALDINAAGQVVGWSETAPAPELTDAELMAAWVDTAQQDPSVAGPTSGKITLETGSVHSDGFTDYLRDFYAHARFINPYPASEHPWDIGFGFRDTGDEDRQFRLIVDSDGNWYLGQGANPPRGIGQVTNLDVSRGGTNELDLVVVGDTGYFAVNGDYVATLDLSANDASGQLWVSSGFFVEDKIDGEVTPYTDFEVWSLEGASLGPSPSGSEEDIAQMMDLLTDLQAQPSDAGPLSGGVDHEADTTNLYSAGVDVRDFAAHVRFTNPYPASEHPWDIGFEFRHVFDDTDNRFRWLELVVDSDGDWQLSSGDDTIASGSGIELNTGANQGNELDLVAIEDAGFLAVNGEFVSFFDLAGHEDSGDVLVGAAFDRGTRVDGEVTPYAEFEVWSLDDVDDDTAVSA